MSPSTTDPFAFADALGPEKVLHIQVPALGIRGVAVVDNVARGPAIGGVRMAPDVTAEEAFRLARAMTYKSAAAGLAHGGGKSVLVGDPHMPAPEKERHIRAFACAIRDLIDYIPGPDMGTDEQCMAWIHDEIGRAAGLPEEIGGIPLDRLGATGFGLAASAEVGSRFCDLPLSGARVAVQGFGNVGQHAARFLAERGAVLVAAADSSATVSDAGGLDVAALRTWKGDGAALADYEKGEQGAPEAIVDVECEIWIPAARPDVLRADNVDRLRTRLVLQGANIPCTPDAERALHARDVVVVPDFVANAGGLICAAAEYGGRSERQAFDEIDAKVRANTEAVLREAQDAGVPPREAALRLAQTRVERAAATRRWHG